MVGFKLEDIFRKFTNVHVVTEAQDDGTISRLAYLNGKLFCFKSQFSSRVQLLSTDVTVAVNCNAVMSLAAPLFLAWKVDDSKLGKSEDATPGRFHTEILHETSPDVPGLPWEFKAYRKVVRFRVMMILTQRSGV